MGMALAWRLSFGLLLLALFSSTQVDGSNRTTTASASNISEVTSEPLGTMNRTTAKGQGNPLQSTAGLFILSVSLLYIC